jgi:hypothetical protein
MPPWAERTGAGPFHISRPAAGPLLSSQPHAATNHAEQPLWALLATPMSARGAAASRCAPPTQLALPTDVAHQPVGHGWPYWALSGTAVALVQSLEGSLEGSIDGSTARTRLEGVPGRWAKSARNRCVRSRALLHPASQSAVRQWRRGQVGASHGVTATLPCCRHEGWDPALRFGAGFGGYSSDAGNKPQPSAGPSPRPACVEVARQLVRPVPPLHSVFGVRSHSWQGFSRPAGWACSRTRRMPTITQLG